MATTAPTTRPVVGRSVRANLSTAELYEDAIRHGEGLVAAEGPLVVRTGKHTGRSPEDKFIVDEPTSRDKIWWGPVNRPISEAHYDRLRARLVDYAASQDLYSQDCFIGAATAHRRSLRVYTETAWASIFARNLFRRPTADQLARFVPNFTIICVPSFQADPATEGTRTGTAILVHLAPDGDHHRRHRVRRRDQEERVHGHELPDARRGRPADALGHQRRPGRRRGGLLRAVGDGQDDPVGRSAAQPHRRRRARLGRRRHASTSRVAATPRRSACRRCTSPTSSRRRAGSGRSSRTSTSTRGRARSTSIRSGSPRTPAAPTRSTSSATPTRPASPARRGRSSS